MLKNGIEALFHLGRDVGPRAPEIDPAITRLFEIAMHSEEVAFRSNETGDRELAR